MFLGHVISYKNIQMDPSNVATIQELKRLSNVGELRSFLGLAGYYRRFVQGFSKITLPLT